MTHTYSHCIGACTKMTVYNHWTELLEKVHKKMSWPRVTRFKLLVHQPRTQCLIQKGAGLGAHVPPCATTRYAIALQVQYSKTRGKVSCNRWCSLPKMAKSRPAAACTTSTSPLETNQIPLLSPERKNNSVRGSW